MGENKNYDDIMKDVIAKGHEIVMDMNVKTENEITEHAVLENQCTCLNAISRFVDAIIEADKFMSPSAISPSVLDENVKHGVVDKSLSKAIVEIEAVGLDEVKQKSNELVETLEKAKSLINELAMAIVITN